MKDTETGKNWRAGAVQGRGGPGWKQVPATQTALTRRVQEVLSLSVRWEQSLPSHRERLWAAGPLEMLVCLGRT